MDDDVGTTTSIASFGRTKDPDHVSVNERIRPENLVDRPAGMPPLISRAAHRQLKELDELKTQNRLLELNDRYSSRNSLNNSMMSRRSSISRSSMIGFGRGRNNNNDFLRNYRNDAIGNRQSAKNEVKPRDLRNRLLNALERKKSESASERIEEVFNPEVNQKAVIASNNIAKMLQRDMLTQYVDVINKNMGRKHDMEVQKEIKALQKKPLLFACGSASPITTDGAGISGGKLKTFATKISTNIRFS